MLKHKIKNLPKYQRPREKLQELGPENVSETDLWAIIFGQGTSKYSVMQLAEKIPALINSSKKIQANTIQQLDGIGPSQALKVLAVQELCRRASQPRAHLALTSPELVAREVRHLFQQKQEQVVALYCNARQELLDHRILAIGKLNSVLLEPRDIFGPALTLPAASFFLIHNHPSGNPSPSEDDKSLTNKVAFLSQQLGIMILDHLIVGHNSWSSFRQLGYLN